MSRTPGYCGMCRKDEAPRLQPGSGVAIAGAIGISSALLGIVVWLSGAGIGWAIATWLVASPCTLAMMALPALGRLSPSPKSCASGRCRFCGEGRNFGRPVNV